MRSCVDRPEAGRPVRRPLKRPGVRDRDQGERAGQHQMPGVRCAGTLPFNAGKLNRFLQGSREAGLTSNCSFGETSVRSKVPPSPASPPFTSCSLTSQEPDPEPPLPSPGVED